MWRWREPLEKKCESLNKLREAPPPQQKLVRKLNSVNSRSDLEEDPKPQMMVQSANTLASALWDPKQKTLQNSELINGCCFKPTPQICANSRKPIFRIGTQFFKQPNSKINDTCYPFSFPYGSVSKESACNAGDPVQFLGWKDPLEKEMATDSSILAWRIPWTEEPGGLQSTGSQESDMT